ncbi:MAG: FAD-dependent oxidoreductase [Noviherbaspirillum sp.]|nr:FAD-dependent oxidoreductase [Noviherbaspirillum sp.]
MHIAIIGAGMAGLSCARQLQLQGHHVSVYERAGESGGRMATRHTELGGFDHGAQYFTADSDRFKKAIAAWERAGWVSPWTGRLVTIENAAPKQAGRSKQRFVGVPGMADLAMQLAQGIEVRIEQLITRIEPHDGRWLLAVQSDTVPIEASAGPFDAVVIAATPNNAVPLLQCAPQFIRPAKQASLEPCWALMLGFQESLVLGYDGAWVQSSRLAWIARDASKPQRRPGEHWVCHASARWSIEHLTDDPERVKEKLLKAFHEATGSRMQPLYAEAYRWRHAQVIDPLPAAYLWDPKLRIGVCGDWFSAGLEGGGRVENAYLSGLALAEAIS